MTTAASAHSRRCLTGALVTPTGMPRRAGMRGRWPWGRGVQGRSDPDRTSFTVNPRSSFSSCPATVGSIGAATRARTRLRDPGRIAGRPAATRASAGLLVALDSCIATDWSDWALYRRAEKVQEPVQLGALCLSHAAHAATAVATLRATANPAITVRAERPQQPHKHEHAAATVTPVQGRLSARCWGAVCRRHACRTAGAPAPPKKWRASHSALALGVRASVPSSYATRMMPNLVVYLRR